VLLATQARQGADAEPIKGGTLVENKALWGVSHPFQFLIAAVVAILQSI
jgi:hypothetical protein